MHVMFLNNVETPIDFKRCEFLKIDTSPYEWTSLPESYSQLLEISFTKILIEQQQAIPELL